MGSESRAIGAFAGLGVVFIIIALVVSHLEFGASGVDKLPLAPPAPEASAKGAVAAPWTAQGVSGAPVKRLLQHPTLSRAQIAFDFAGEIWVVGRDGGEAQRLVTGQLLNERPIFSPDGSTIAFTGTYDGNTDVYTVPAIGGEPMRLTYSPERDEAVGWTPDGARVLMQSMRETARDFPKLFTVSRTGGLPEALPLPSGTDACYSPDGKRLAYTPFSRSQPGWKQYRGGQTTPIWIADLSDSHITKVPRDESNDRLPMWVGDTIYFLSDRNLATDHRGTFTIFADDLKTNAVREVVHNPDGFEVRYASAGPGAIVYEQLGALHLYDLASRTARQVPVTISADLPQLRPRFVKVRPEQVLHAAVSPTGKRVLFEARGEILSVPAEKGDVRNLTRTPAVADRDPAWSPDGKWIAWLSDQSGEYALYFRSPDGIEPPKKIDLGDPPSFFYAPKVVARQQEGHPDRQAAEPLAHRHRPSDAGEGRHAALRGVVRPRVVARFALGRVRQGAREPPSRRLRLLARGQADPPDHRRPERRVVAALRPQRQVPVVPRADRLRARRVGRGDDGHGAAGHEQRLRRRAPQGPAFAGGAGERRGGGRLGHRREARQRGQGDGRQERRGGEGRQGPQGREGG